MKVIHARNVNEALLLGLLALKEEGVDRDSRNGPVTLFPGPVTTLYTKPQERVVFYPERDANPFFHFMESLWMLAGRRDVFWVSQFAANITNYTDDGVNFHGAYGYRWRNHFLETNPGDQQYGPGVIDQLGTIANLLRNNPDDRRVVLQMWDTQADLGLEGKDFPCNLMATFRINPYGKLDMTVFNRSNDMIWGAYGANAVHFSVLQEVMAAWIGVPIGHYWQVSTNFHGYHATLEKHKELLRLSAGFDDYTLGYVEPSPIVNTAIDIWFQDLQMFMDEGPVMGFQDPFFKKTASPMWNAWFAWKDKDNPNRVEKAIGLAKTIQASDWRKACVEWLERRA
jgi:thymidylate synthase